MEGEKLSTSRNHAVWLHEYLRELPGRRDELRYVLTSISPETKDADFTWKDYQQKVNSELVSILGNLVNRVMVLTWKYFEGKTPSEESLDETSESRSGLVRARNQAVAEFNASIREMINALESFRFREAQFHMMNLSRAGNKFLAETQPWKLAGNDTASVGFVLHFALKLCGNIAMACEPFLPDGAAILHRQLASEPLREGWLSFWKTGELIDTIPGGHQLGRPELLYRNVEDTEIAPQIAKLAKAKEENAASADGPVDPLKPQITFDDFAKLDIRIGKVLNAEKVEKSAKLLKLTVDTGVDRRVVLSGIAKHYKPEDMIGRQVTLIANLAPRKMMGMESQGMILMAEDADGKLRLLLPSEPVVPGSSVS